MALDKNQIAERIAQELEHNMYVNLGIGIPTLVANYIPKGIDIEFQSENGVLGMGPFPYEGEEDPDMINAGKQTITTMIIELTSGFCCFVNRYYSIHHRIFLTMIIWLLHFNFT